MIVVRFKVKLQPGKAEEALPAFERVVGPSRRLEGVVSFDIGRDITDPDAIVATEVFEDQAALDRQEAQQEVADVVALLEDVAAGPPEHTIFHVSSSESPAG